MTPTVLSGTGVEHELALIRHTDTGVADFRSGVYRIGLHLAAEVSKHLTQRNTEVVTPLTTTTGKLYSGTLVLVPVLRAGLGLLDAFLHVLPYARVGFEGLRRDEETLQPHEYYSNIPQAVGETDFVVLDPMIATGGSLCATIERLKREKPRSVVAAGVIAAPEGLERVTSTFPDVRVVVGALDSHLNDVGYIVPGLGDAGDRLFGT